MEVFHNLAFGFEHALTWHNLMYCAIGCVVGTLVGLLPGDTRFVAPEGSHLVASAARPTFDPSLGSPSIGHVTSSYFSPNLGRAFALALVVDGRALEGNTIQCLHEGRLQPMKVVDPVFYDKEGKRRDGID